MARTRNDVEFFRFGGQLVCILAEVAGMGIFACDKQDRAGRNRFDLCEWEEIHQRSTAGKRDSRCAAGVLSARSAIVVVKLKPHRIVRSGMLRRADRIFRRRASELGPASFANPFE